MKTVRMMRKTRKCFAKIKLETTTNFVNLLRTSAIQLISIISNYSIHQMLLKKFLHNFQITNHLICSLFNSCMTLTEFIALYCFIIICCYLFSPEGLIFYRPAKNFSFSNCITIITVNTSR